MSLPVDPELYLAFLGVVLITVITPGPAILFAVATGVRHGRRAVVLATAGMNTASVFWYIAAAMGLAGLAAAFPRAFQVLRYAGAAYLVWLGAAAIWSARRAAAPPDPAARPSGRAFRDGFVVQITNPKALLFITAILPPFIDPGRPLIPQIVLFAIGGIVLDVISMLAYGLGGARLSSRMAQPRFRSGFAVFTGALLLLAALLILLRS